MVGDTCPKVTSDDLFRANANVSSAAVHLHLFDRIGEIGHLAVKSSGNGTSGPDGT